MQHKGIPFITQCVNCGECRSHFLVNIFFKIQVGEIQAKAEEIGAPPTRIRPDGTPQYTLPFIFDSATNMAVADSFFIAKYLDDTYPVSGPKLLPDETEILQRFFASDTSITPMTSLALPDRIKVYHKLSPSMQVDYLKIGFPFDPNEKLEEREVAEMWAQAETALGKIDVIMGKRETLVREKEPTFADEELGATLLVIKLVMGADSKEWELLSSKWHGGRWGKYLKWLENYEPSSA